MISHKDSNALIIYRVGPVLCCGSSLSVDSIILPPALNHPPGTSNTRPGVFRHAGHIFSVIDLRRVFGVPEEQINTTAGRVIVTEVEAGRTGFWVDEIIDVIEMPMQGWGSLPTSIPRGIFTRTLLLNEQIHLYAEFEKLSTIKGSGYLHQHIETLVQAQAQGNIESVATSVQQVAPIVTKPVETTSSAVVTPPMHSETRTTTPAPVAASENKKSDVLKTSARPTPVTTPAPESVRTASTEKPKSDSPAPPLKKQATVVKQPAQATTIKTNQPRPAQPTPTYSTTRAPEVQAPQQQATHSVRPALSDTKPVQTSQLAPSRDSSSTNHNRPQQQTVSPVASIAPNTESTEQAQDDSSSLGMVAALIVFLCLAGGGYYFYNSMTQPEPLLQPMAQASPELAPVTELQQTVPVPVEPESEKPLEIAQTNTQAAPPQPEYRASIDQDEQGITITLDTPNNEPALKLETDVQQTVNPDERITDTVATTPVVETRADTMTPSAENPASQVSTTEEKMITVKTDPPVEKPATTKQISRREVIHIVIKGDTLWDIAEKYVHNPFLYPELAKLSNIRNPDRIYPGNRVRIIQLSHNE